MAHLARRTLVCQRCVADEHAEAGLEGSHGGLGVGGGDVVDCDAAVGLEVFFWELRDAKEGAVAGAEVKDGCPVVGKVLGKGAGCAG